YQLTNITTTVIVRLKKTDGTLLATHTINNQPGEACQDRFFDESPVFTYLVGNEEKILLEIETQKVYQEPSNMSNTLKQRIFIDNLKVEVAEDIKVLFDYNDRGHRVRKQSFESPTITTTTNYVRDASGTALAVYETTINTTIHTIPQTKKENGVYGNGRIG